MKTFGGFILVKIFMFLKNLAYNYKIFLNVNSFHKTPVETFDLEFYIVGKYTEDSKK